MAGSRSSLAWRWSSPTAASAGPGFGYRRILDVAPIIWPMLGWVFRRGMSWEAKVAIAIGIAVNAYGIWAIEVLHFVAF